jgi:hypothetical protein
MYLIRINLLFLYKYYNNFSFVIYFFIGLFNLKLNSNIMESSKLVENSMSTPKKEKNSIFLFK